MQYETERRFLDAMKPYRHQISDYAFDLIRYAIDMVERDPHTSWKTTSLDERRKAQDAAITELPKVLSVLQKRTSFITTFDILHAISNFVEVVCPFEKDGTKEEETEGKY
jgi:predicted translin family RNA/ssDNA-binding protein